MTGRIKVVVATTEGPSTVLRVTPEDPSLRSVVCLGRSTTALPISPAYDAFVRKPTGVIEKAVGHAAFRVDVSAPIEDGKSWQLGLYLAHRLKAADRLAEDDEPAELVLWVTGAVDGDLKVHPVEHMKEKQRRSAELFAEVGHRVLAVVPVDQAESLTDLPDSAQSLAIGTVAPLLRHLGLEPPLKPYSLRRRSRWPLVGLALATLVAGAVVLIPRRDDSPPVPTSVPVAPPAVDAAPVVKRSGIRLEVLEARPADGTSCDAGLRLQPVDPGRETPPGVCAVTARAVNQGRAPGYVWLVALAEGAFREYSGGSRSVGKTSGTLAAGDTAEVRVGAPSWVRRRVAIRVLLVLAEREHPQVSDALSAVNTLSGEDLDRLAARFRKLGVEVRTYRHMVQPRP